MTRNRWILGILLAIALLVRLAHWQAVRSDPFHTHPVLDSQTYDLWAQEIAGGDWVGQSTFFQAPLYPYSVGLVYRAVGRSLNAVYLAQILLSVLAVWWIYATGRQLVGERFGLLAAALAVAAPTLLFYDAQLLKTSLATTLVAGLLWAVTRAWCDASARWWAATGVLGGLLALLRENVLLVLPLLVLLAAWPSSGRRGVRIGALLGGIALVLLPVSMRNVAVGGDLLPTASNGGLNFYIGNNPQADGNYRALVPGKQTPYFEQSDSRRLAEAATGRSLTASEVSSFWLGRSLDWVRAEPLAFVALQVRKVGLFFSFYEWPDAVDYYYVQELSPAMNLPGPEFGSAVLLAALGLVLLVRHPERRRFLPVLLFAMGFVASTVLFFVFSRFRAPLLPALFLLGAVALDAFAEALRRHRSKLAGGLGLLILLAWIAPSVVPREPRMDLVHYNLARIAQEEGRDADAVSHYLATLESDPQNFLARLNLGGYAARGRQWEQAATWFREALEIEPSLHEARANLGGVYLAQGQIERAIDELSKVLRDDPNQPHALANLAIAAERMGDLAAARRYRERLAAVHSGHPQAEEFSARRGDGAP